MGVSSFYHLRLASFLGDVTDMCSETGQVTISSLPVIPIAFWIIWIFESNCRMMISPANRW
jgi:hypothetical protein